MHLKVSVFPLENTNFALFAVPFSSSEQAFHTIFRSFFPTILLKFSEISQDSSFLCTETRSILNKQRSNCYVHVENLVNNNNIWLIRLIFS